MSEARFANGGTKGFLAVAAVFCLGAVFGAALCFALVRLAPGRPSAGFDREERAGRFAIARMARDLDLDAEQREQVRAIVERSRDEIREHLERSRGEIRALLRPEQQERFDRMPTRRPRLRRR